MLYFVVIFLNQNHPRLNLNYSRYNNYCVYLLLLLLIIYCLCVCLFLSIFVHLSYCVSLCHPVSLLSYCSLSFSCVPKSFNELIKLSTQESGNQEMLGALNLKSNHFEVQY